MIKRALGICLVLFGLVLAGPAGATGTVLYEYNFDDTSGLNLTGLTPTDLGSEIRFEGTGSGIINFIGSNVIINPDLMFHITVTEMSDDSVVNLNLAWLDNGGSPIGSVPAFLQVFTPGTYWISVLDAFPPPPPAGTVGVVGLLDIGVVGGGEFSITIDHYQITPEPSLAVILGIGFLGLAGTVGRRRRA